MGEHSAIEWTHHTFNPWWGCTKVSEACRNCYAESTANRFAPGNWGPKGRRRFFGDKHWSEPLKWNRKAAKLGERHRVFCASMADVFEGLGQDHPDFYEMHKARLRLWDLIEMTPHLDWLLLTKRPEHITMFAPWQYERLFLPNVWLGTTVEDQPSADERVPYLVRAPATVHFISSEPLLGPVVLEALSGEECGECGEKVLYNAFTASAHCDCCVEGAEPVDWQLLDWVIAGGESGCGARPSHPEWFRSLRDQCVTAEVPFLFKQWGAWGPNGTGGRATRLRLDGGDATTQGSSEHDVWMHRLGKKHTGRELDGRTWDEVPNTQETP